MTANVAAPLVLREGGRKRLESLIRFVGIGGGVCGERVTAVVIPAADGLLDGLLDRFGAMFGHRTESGNDAAVTGPALDCLGADCGTVEDLTWPSSGTSGPRGATVR
jgi:hypothetical protein